MARPESNTVSYFPFYCEEGSKMHYLEETYGNDGFATFVKLLRELAKTENHYLDLSKKTTSMFLAAKCKIPITTLELIINDLVELGKFDQVLWSENKIIWCEDFIKSIQDAYLKRKSKCMTYQGLLSLLASLGVRKPSKLPTKSGINTQSKEDENKEKEIKIEEKKIAFGYSLKEFEKTYSKDMLTAFFRYWSEKNKSGTKMKWELEKTFELSLRLSNWASREKDFDKPQGKETPKVASKPQTRTQV